jgi:hypothetical protein
MGTILSCIPGKLGFFRGEDMQSELLLEHTRQRPTLPNISLTRRQQS